MGLDKAQMVVPGLQLEGNGKVQEEGYSLFIGIPTYGKPNSLFSVDSGWSLLFHIGRHHPEIKKVWVHQERRTYRQEARQACVVFAQELGATHLLMLDDDHVFDGTVFDKLWEYQEKHMVSALYMTRGLPCAPCMFRMTDQGTVPIYVYPKDELLSVDVVGFGFVLFKMEVFKRINPPWFNLSTGFGEDAAFCGRLLQAGLGVFCHTGAKIGHILDDPYVVTEADYERVRDRIQVATPQLVPQPDDPNGSKVGSRPWWRPFTGRTWFYKTKRGQGEEADQRHGTLLPQGDPKGQEGETSLGRIPPEDAPVEAAKV